MKTPHYIHSTVKYLFFSSLLVSLSGCIFIPYTIKEEVETSINENDLEKKELRKKTRLEIIEWLGTPDAIAHKNKVIKVPPIKPKKEGSLDVKSKEFFDLFSKRDINTDKHIIYYYETSAYHAGGAIIVVWTAGSSGQITPLSLKVSRLWILIDTETGHVVDYIFRREKINKKNKNNKN